MEMDTLSLIRSIRSELIERDVAKMEQLEKHHNENLEALSNITTELTKAINNIAIVINR